MLGEGNERGTDGAQSRLDPWPVLMEWYLLLFMLTRKGRGN